MSSPPTTADFDVIKETMSESIVVTSIVSDVSVSEVAVAVLTDTFDEKMVDIQVKIFFYSIFEYFCFPTRIV